MCEPRSVLCTLVPSFLLQRWVDSHLSGRCLDSGPIRVTELWTNQIHQSRLHVFNTAFGH